MTVDAATCCDCLAELFDPANRRHRYPLINCTACGPRFSLIMGVPYDRPNTTMAPFPMCAACRAEYEDPTDRRHHAQPTCCPDCGPHLRAAPPAELMRAPRPDSSAPALEALVAGLAAGGVAAVQGLGGFHLAALADDERAVARLRSLKRRDAKPFAVMVRDLEAAARFVRLSAAGQDALTSVERPIVLAEAGDPGLAATVAPGTHRVGVMIPHTPIQHLLFADPRLAERPLVMTSANVSDAPMLHRPEALAAELGGVELVVWHDRAIARRVDDSIVLDGGQGRAAVPVRRARGFVPGALPLAADTEGLAVGGDLKNTFCLVRSGEAILSAHHGDLAHRRARDAFEAELERLLTFFSVRPRWLACDLHPDFASTRVAERLARQLDAPLLRVQHHFAHAASLLAERGEPGPALFVVCDGFGHGLDGATWGGELLLAGLDGFRRLACLAPVLAVGGDRYAREPARPALAWLAAALGASAEAHPAARRLVPDPERRRRLLALGARQGRPSHSAGRLFDAAAALLGLGEGQNRFEAESAMALEAAAVRGAPREDAPPVVLRSCEEGLRELRLLDPRRLMLWLAERDASEAADAARSFHERLAEGFAAAALAALEDGAPPRVGLSGGVAVNQTFTGHLRRRLESSGVELFGHARVPPTDGGLALGQAAIAARVFDVAQGRS